MIPQPIVSRLVSLATSAETTVEARADPLRQVHAAFRCNERDLVGRSVPVPPSCERSRCPDASANRGREHTMEVATGRAKLVELADDSASAALATLPRREIEEALRMDDGPPELILDVTRNPGQADEQLGKILILWGPDELEELLRRAEGDSVTLAFDPDELSQALDADVEGHGLREAVAVLAVAVAAGTAAGVATAGTAEGTTVGGSAAIEQVRSEAGAAPGAAIEAVRSAEAATSSVAAGDYGMPRPTLADYGLQPGTDIEAVRLAAAAESAESSAVSAGDYGMPQATPADYGIRPATDIEAVRLAAAAQSAEASAVSAGDYGMPQATPADYGIQPATDIEAVRSAASAGGLTGAECVEEVRSAEIAASVSGAEATSSIEAVRSAAAEASRATADTGGGISISMPSPEATGAISGAIALLITGAAFAARRQTPMRPA